MSEGTKKAAIFQEGIHHLSHVAHWLPWCESARHMSEWAITMRVSGYTEEERYDAIRGACMRQAEMARMVDHGEIPSFHRSRQDIPAIKAKKTGMQASTWYLRDNITRSIKCYPTPGGVLAQTIPAALNPDGCKTMTHVR